MLPIKNRHLLYAVLLLGLSIIGTRAIANTNVYDIFWASLNTDSPAEQKESDSDVTISTATEGEYLFTQAPMFMTIIQGANEEVVCPNDGSTLAKFFLCGTSDIRAISLSVSGSSYEWQKLDSNRCAPSVIDDCANTGNTCYDTVGTGSTYNLDSAGEFRVRVDGGQYYYFKATLNPLNPQLIKEDIICGNPGRVEITNVPAGYEYSLNSPSGPYQNDPFFDVTNAGNYTVYVRLQNVSGSACLFPSNTVTVQDLDITVDVTANDILCSGELGSIDVSASGVPGFFTYRLIKNGVTVDTFGPDAASNYTFANVSPGIYTVRVETNKCNELITLDTNGDPIEIGNGISPLAVSATATDSFGCGAASVDVTIETSGGTAPYRYSLDGGATFSPPYGGTDVFTVTSAGTYNILVEDANGCTRTANVDVEDLPPPVFTVTELDANCGGVNDGSIVVNVTNGFGYNLEFSIDNGVNYQTGNVFTGLAPGSYNVVIRYQQDSFSCTTPSTSATVGTPSTISGTANADSVPSCLDETGGQITIYGVSGGTAPYDYSIGAGFSATTVFTNLGVGTYTPQIRDANGCVQTLAPIVFNPLDKPTDLDFTISSIDCITTTATVTVAVTDGTAPFTYEIIAPAASVINNGNNNVFTGLGLGTYTFRVTDTEGCSYDESYAITDISSISVQAQQTKVVTCVGDSDGEGRFLVDGFDTTYSYSIDGGPLNTGETSGIIPLTGLSAGSYVITVTDEDTNCTDTATLVIEEPAVALAISNLNVTPMNCQNGNIGNVTVNTVGGWGGNRYELIQPNGVSRGPKNGNTFSNLSQDGLYQVIVTDNNGCTVTDTFTLTSLASPAISLDAVASDFCYDNVDAATLAVNAAGGLPPYQYRINGGPLVGSSSFAGLTPDTYTIEVVDANDCRDDITLVIEPEISATATTIQELTCGGPDAQIRVNISNGYPSGGDYDYYEVSIDGAPYTTGNFNITGNSFIYSIPNNGTITTDTTFQFEVYDSEGCMTVTNVVTISPTEAIAGAAVPTNTTCGDDNGIIELVPDTNFGVPPYEFSIDNGATFSTQNIYSGFPPGTHSTFMIRDSRGCTTPLLSATVAASTPIDATIAVTDAVCGAGTVEGIIDVTAVANGTADYTYTVLDINGNPVATAGPTASTTANFPNLVPGTYTVVTQDASGCEDRDTVTISQNQLDLIPVSTTTPADCTSAFTYIVDIVGGTPPYQIGLLGGPLGPPNVDADTHDFTGQITYGVTFFVEVIDALGCRYIEQIDPIPGPNPLNVAATATSASCAPGGNGQIDYQVTGVGSPTDIIVSLQDTNTGAIVVGPTTLNNVTIPYNGSFSALPPGNYQVIVQDIPTSCRASDLVDIIQDIPAIVVDSNVPATCNVGALVTVRGNGGTPGYEFAYVPTGDPAPTTYSTDTTFEIAGPYPEDYDFYVRDSNGCVNFTTVTVTEAVGVPDPTVNVINQCTAVANYDIFVTSPLTSGPEPENTFEYDIGGGFQSSPNFTVPNPGDYTIVVRDGNGCTNTVVARVFDFFAITASATSEPTCNAGDGVITVNTTGGSGNFRFDLDDGINPTVTQINDPVFINLPPGNYSILVTDLDSNTVPLCTDTAVVDVTVVNNPVIAATPKGDITCNGANDGYIDVELLPGSDTDSPFSYILYDGGTPTVVRPAQGSSLFDNLAPGTYQVEVISDRGCTVRSGDVDIIEPSPLQIATTATTFTCDPNSNRFNTATITVYTDTNGDGTGTDTGTGPYTYSMNDGTPQFDGTNFQTSNTFEIIDNGGTQNIIITARDQNGCEIIDSVTLNPPSDLTFSFNVNPITCDVTGFGVNPGTIEIIINEGPGNYDVEILPLGSQAPQNSGGTDRVSWAIDTPGDYIFAVTDIGNGGCSYLTPIVNVPEYNTIDAVIAEVSPVTCFGGNDGEISIQVNNYAGAYNYEVFSRDNAGVETSTGESGTFDTTVPGQNPAIIGNLPAGNLVVRVEALDTPFCDTSSNVATVRQPDRGLTVALQQTSEVTCATPGLGEIFATGDGGWGGYEYQLIAPDGVTIIQDFPDTNNTFSGLSDGTYTVNIRDAEGCVNTNTINLALPAPIFANIRITNPLACNNDNDGVIEAYDMSGGQGAGNYLFQLNRLSEGTNSGLQTSPTFANLSAGDYTITVFDGWDCSFTTVPITITDPEIVIAELVELQPPGCGDVGVMELTVTNPEPGVSYFYRRSGTADPFLPFDNADPLATSVQITENITIDPGPFQYDVQNSNGCPFEKSNQISLDPAAPLVISLDLTNATINCAGEATGIIRSEAFGGIGNYFYTLLNSDTPPNPTATNTVRSAQSSGIFRDLGPGTYWVYAQSGGCEAISTPITITDPPPLVLDYVEAVPVSCFGDTDGQLIIEASGGTGVIRYSIADQLSEFFEGDDPMFPNRKTFTDLAPRSYEVIIQDDLGCTITQTITITEPTELVAGIADSTPETCLGDTDGTVTLQVNGGTPPYEFAVNSSDPADFAPNPSQFFDGLTGGDTYVIFVRDSQGCETNVIVPVGIGVDLMPEALVTYGCEGIFPNNSVEVVVQDTSQYPLLLYALDPMDPTDAITAQAGDVRQWGDLAAGDHTVYIYHQNGCTTSVDFTIDAYDPLTLEVVKTAANEITATATGGYGGYEYFFNSVSYGSDNVYTSNQDETVTVRVVDLQGCEAVMSFPFDFTGMLDIPNFFTPDGDNNNDFWFPRNRDFFPNIEVIIYDRYGRVVARLDQVSKWDGNYDGKPVPTGDYWYVVNANDKEKQQYVGHFTLYR
ncbi:T9SS type B sorting domain-containing protein [Lentiprolixibacter aurantiacus]|uniref:T9SS type B sorting domain-containing protein n=1 Tax=Lentiprolixibacter aurantiacus TaxID=2993939 RepID=A0AAE3MME2_9FLAO|nr:T9SS type B sorting domain-containing protein [Lentiprolixibacter aurantiacus]MCX2720386.1 T9SS type B sorting domain-containing protein [Lentiprolixibacter aurantiacus]